MAQNIYDDLKENYRYLEEKEELTLDDLKQVAVTLSKKYGQSYMRVLDMLRVQFEVD